MLRIPTSKVKQIIQQAVKSYEYHICSEHTFYDFTLTNRYWELIAEDVINEFEDYECQDG